MSKLKIRKNDNIKVICGRTQDKGRTGKVLWVDKANQRVLIEGINMRKKAMRKTQQNPKGGIIEIEAPVHISNIIVINSKSNKPAKVGFKKNDAGKTVRYDKKTGDILDME